MPTLNEMLVQVHEIDEKIKSCQTAISLTMGRLSENGASTYCHDILNLEIEKLNQERDSLVNAEVTVQ